MPADKAPPADPPAADLAAVAEDLQASLLALSSVGAAGLPDLLARIDALKAKVDALERRIREEMEGADDQA
ncbi:hypothetical protein GE253_17585 [Niveispirillum sp. SYP-B3756]|uniref:hypothetical protein n=1 Tax=Niveispirillum sp. SYP-B3756 TaxID=2662178 RepID=UPI001291D105|nr:hypothetical protein [Niveispirillum sp. SYP-B3756]MQP67141.1 hypothetical protein [Niveispirillum sp. SYP-B3756]